MKWLSCLTRRAETKILAGASLVYSLMIWLMPQVAVAVAALGLVLTALLIAARLACALSAQPDPVAQRPVKDDFVSIHIATYSEPAEVVCRTLDSLARLSYQNYEVIVLDNNTPDPELYLPVQAHCEKLGSKFRFFHYDNVQGAKAGALNISLGLCDPRTRYLLILDADYQAQPDILQAGLSHFVDSRVALVQFPQAYRNSEPSCGLTWEYKLFFDVYMNLANRYNTVLSTGTAAFVSRVPLERSGGWSGDTLTEDAELGLRLHRHGYHGVYVPEERAVGVMPTDLDSLRAQRRRWVLGNAQSLSALWREKSIGWGRKAVMSLQLTAWASPLMLSLVSFMVGALAYELLGHAAATAVLAMSTLSIAVYLVGMLAFFLVALLRQGQGPLVALKAYLVHLGLLWEASVCWCELFVQSDKSFVRTDKFLRAPKWLALLGTMAAALASGVAGLGVVWSGGSFVLGLVFGLVALLVLGRAFLRWNLHQIRSRTA